MKDLSREELGPCTFPAGIRALALAAALLLGVAAPAHSQSGAEQAPASQSPAPRPPTPQWEIDAGGKMEFDVASVKPDTADPTTARSNIPIGPQDLFTPTGGLMNATNFPLIQYMIFAYKLTADQVTSVLGQLPKWATTERFDIQGRASGNPRKDQYRLMMQAVLADRFKLAVHYEIRQLPVMALVLDKPGKLGPQLRQHPDDGGECSIAQPPPGTQGPLPTTPDGFPQICGALVGLQPSNPGRIHVGGRNVPLYMFSPLIQASQVTGVDRPVIDKTGISGKVDFNFEFTPTLTQPLPPGANFEPDPTGPSFIEALKQQLGLKLETQTGPVTVIVVDHVEQPSEN